jgi:hypothetical protein
MIGEMAREKQLSLFHLEPEHPSFEDLGNENGGKYWYARDFMAMLGYESLAAFQEPINKAIATCTALNIPVLENFQHRIVNGESVSDFRLTRFACYLISINGDVRKPEVAGGSSLLRHDGGGLPALHPGHGKGRARSGSRGSLGAGADVECGGVRGGCRESPVFSE